LGCARHWAAPVIGLRRSLGLALVRNKKLGKGMRMKLEELRVYNLANEAGEKVWIIVAKWDYFAKSTVGKQWVRAVDSMAANLSEGFGRYHYKETRQFGYYSRGSLFESKTWLTKAHKRKLVSDDEYANLMQDLNTIGIKLNKYINSIGTRKGANEINEDSASYLVAWDENDNGCQPQ
jgi:four helix bundle protein